MKKVNENQKVTLTVGQLKRLVKESDDSVIRELEKDIRFCKSALDYPNERAAMDAKANYGKEWKKRTREDLKDAKAKLKKLDPSNYLLNEEAIKESNEGGFDEVALEEFTTKLGEEICQGVQGISEGQYPEFVSADINDFLYKLISTVKRFAPDSDSETLMSLAGKVIYGE